MSLQTVRRVAADILNAGESRIRINDPKRASDALTREDVRNLIREKAVIVIPKDGVSRGKVRGKLARKHEGRGRGPGSRRGRKYAGVTRKQLWMRKVRSQRSALKNSRFKLQPGEYRAIYRMVTGNAFRGKKQLQEFISSKSAKRM